MKPNRHFSLLIDCLFARYDCQNVTRSGIRRLRTKLPQIKVHAYFAPSTPPSGGGAAGGSRTRLMKYFVCCQAQVQSPKVQIPVKGLGVTLKSHRPPTHPQLLSMKECSREKVIKGKKSQCDPPPTPPVGPGGQQDQEHGVVLHNQEEGYQTPITFRSGSSQVP